LLSNGEIALRLILSALAGGIVGMEREANNHPAGLRTHILVSLGSTLIMLISMYGFQGPGINNSGDPARLAAQVVSGIGFLGAGTIIRTGNNIRGLTTAASIWVCGGIGLAIGNGYYLGGLTTAIIVLFTLGSLGFIENKIFKNQYKLLSVHCRERAGLIGDIGHILGKHSIIIKDIKVDREDNIEEGESSSIEITFTLKLPSRFINDSFFDEILNVDGVEDALWDRELGDAYLY